MSGTASTTVATAQATSPYVGPRPFERAETPSFKGRERETLELLSMVVSSRVVLLYAPSGAGKTSLLNAGLIPALEREGFDLLPVARIRPLMVDAAPSPDAANVYAFGLLSNWANVAAETTIKDFLASRERTLDSQGFLDPRAIVLDQFEELFTAHPDRWPQRQPFLAQLTEALRDDPLLRVVLAIREDYLAQLEGYAGVLPERLRHRYRLDRLGRDAALSAITAPLEPTARSFAPGVAEKLVDDLLTFRVDRGDGTSVNVPGEFVEPVQLQVVCERLWAGLPQDVTEITQQHLRASGDVDEVLRLLYADALRSAASRSGVPEARLRRWIEEMLITPGGTRGTVYRAASSTAQLSNDAVDELERCRVIRAEWRAGARWYELTHDRLIEPIQTSNAAYFAAAATRRRRRLIASASVALPLLVAAVVTPLLISRSPGTKTRNLEEQLALVQKIQRYGPDSKGLGGAGDQAMFGVTSMSSGDGAVAVGLSGRHGERYGAIWEFGDGSWRRDDRVAPPGVFNAVAAAGTTVVVVGTAGPVADPLTSRQDATVWTLVRGRWTHACGAECGDGAGGGGHHGQTMYDVVARRGGGFVAVGYDLSDVRANPRFDAAVWTSPDGVRWSRLPNLGDAFGTGRDASQVMKAVTETPSGLLVGVGRDGLEGAVWISTDGRQWTRVRSADLKESNATGIPTASLELDDVVSAGSRVVAVGRRGDTRGNRNEAAVWLSDDDGNSWRRVRSPVFETQSGGQRRVRGQLTDQQRGQQMHGVATVPFGFVAVGVDHPSGRKGPATAAVWTSLDGEVWTPLSSPSLAGQGNFSMQAVASASDNIVAVGAAPAPSGRGSGRQDAEVWSTFSAPGMKTRPTATRTAAPLSRSQVHRILSSSYHGGKLIFGGVEYDGKHQALVESPGAVSKTGETEPCSKAAACRTEQQRPQRPINGEPRPDAHGVRA